MRSALRVSNCFRLRGGDHEIIVGEVLDFSDFKRAPLVFQGGNYALAFKKPIGRNPATADGADFGAFTKDYLGNLLSVAHLQMRSRLRPALEARGFDEEDYAILSLPHHLGPSQGHRGRWSPAICR